MFFAKTLTLLHFIHLTVSCVCNMTLCSRLDNQTQQAFKNANKDPDTPVLKFDSIKCINSLF